MNVGLYQAASGMRANMERQQVIALNLARQGVAGSRSLIPAFEVNVDKTPKAENTEKKPFHIAEHTPLKTELGLDFTQGPISNTGNPLNFAVQGEGFFRVRESSGTESYTRNGNFMRAKDGRVVTTDGAEVLLDGGTPLTIPSTGKVEMNESGIIRVNGTEAGKLAFAHFDDPGASLKESGTGRLVAKNADAAKSGLGARDTVVQNALEGSNTDPVGASVSMIQVMRLYEANQRAMIAQDEATGRLIRTVGERL